MANYCWAGVRFVGERAHECARTASTIGRWLDELPEIREEDGGYCLYGSVAWSASTSLLTEPDAVIPYTELCKRFGTRMEIYSQEDTFEEHFIGEPNGTLSVEETHDITNVCLVTYNGMIDVEASRYDCGSLTEDMLDDGIFPDPSAVPFEKYAILVGKYCSERLRNIDTPLDANTITEEILRRLNNGETEFAINGFSGEWTI